MFSNSIFESCSGQQLLADMRDNSSETGACVLDHPCCLDTFSASCDCLFYTVSPGIKLGCITETQMSVA